MKIKLTHRNLIVLAQKLGYSHCEGGICRGFSGMFAQAVLAEDERQFWSRLKLIESYVDDNFAHLVIELDVVKDKVKQKQPLSEHEQELLSLLAFFDGVSLYLHPDVFINLFGEIITQNDLHKIYPVCKSMILQDTRVSFPLETSNVLNREGFTAFLQRLENQFRLNHFPSTPIILSNNKHSVAIKYDPGNRENPWLMVDTNGMHLINLSKDLYQTSNSINFVDSVFNALTQNEYLAFSMTVLSKTAQPTLDVHLDRPNRTAYNNDGVGALYLACQSGHIEIVQALLEHPDIDLNKADKDGYTPLYLACQNGHTEIVQALLKQQSIDINKVPNKEDTLLDILYTEILKALGIQHNKVTNKGLITPLYISCQNGYTEIVKALLKQPCIDLNKADKDGFTPLYLACQNGHTEIVKALLEHPDIDPNKACKGWTPLNIAYSKGHREIVKALLKQPHIDINKACNNGLISLDSACFNGDTEIVKALLKQPHIDINKANNNGSTLLYRACQNGHTEIVKALLEHPDIDPNKAFKGWPPLDIAYSNGHTEIVKALLEHPDIDFNKAYKGCTLLDIAYSEGHIEIVKQILGKSLSILDKNIRTQTHHREFYKNLMALRALLFEEIASSLSLLNHPTHIKAVIDNINQMIEVMNSPATPSDKLDAIHNCYKEIYPFSFTILKALFNVWVAAMTVQLCFMMIPAIPISAVIMTTGIIGGLTSYGLFRSSPRDTAINRCIENAEADVTHSLEIMV